MHIYAYTHTDSGRREDINYFLLKRIIWGVKWAGIGIPDPTQTTPTNSETTEHFFEVLPASFLNRGGWITGQTPLR